MTGRLEVNIGGAAVELISENDRFLAHTKGKDEEPNIMKKPLSLCVASLLIGMTTTTLSGGQDRTENKNIKNRFIGAWRLVSLEAPEPDGKIHRSDSTGLLVFPNEATCRSRSWNATRQHKPLPGLSNIRKAGTRPPLADTRSTRALTLSSSMLRVH